MRILYHARQQTNSRLSAINISPDDVLKACQNVENEVIKNRAAWQVAVIIRKLERRIVAADGSNGNLVIALIDPRDCEIKTVILRNEGQKPKPGTIYISSRG